MEDGASTLLRGLCSVIACLLLGSICPVHALLSANASWAEPIPGGALPGWRGASRSVLPGDLCRKPQTCCPSGPEHGVPSGLAGRTDRPDTLLAFPGSWCEALPLLSTNGWKSVCHRTELPKLCWKHLSRQPSSCKPFPGPRPVPSTESPSKWLGLLHWSTLIRRRPWRHAWNGTRGFSQRWRGHIRSRPSCSAGDAAAMRPSIVWNVLRRREAQILKEAASCCMVRARSGVTTTLIRAESRTAPRKDIPWLGDSALLAKLTLSHRHSKWLRRRVLWDSNSASDWAKMSQSSR